jgi:hypothetical protein
MIAVLKVSNISSWTIHFSYSAKNYLLAHVMFFVSFFTRIWDLQLLPVRLFARLKA